MEPFLNSKVRVLIPGVLVATLLGIIIYWLSQNQNFAPSRINSSPQNLSPLESKVVYLGYPETIPELEDILTAIKAEYIADSEGFTIELVKIPSATAEPSSTSSKAEPEKHWELAIAPNEFALGWSESGNLHPITEFADLSRFHALALDAVSLEGSFLGMPLFMGNHLVLFYNKKLQPQPIKETEFILNESVSSAQPSSTALPTTALTNLPTTLQTPGNLDTSTTTSTHAFGFDSQNVDVLFAVMSALKAWPLQLDPNGKLATQTDHTNLRKAFEVLLKWQKSTGQKLSQCFKPCLVNDFVAGKFSNLMAPENWTADIFKLMGDSLGISTLPVLSETRENLAPVVTGTSAFVYAALSLEKENAVRKILSYLGSRKFQVSLAQRFFKLPAMQEAQFDDGIQSNLLLRSLLESISFARVAPLHTQYAEIRSLFSETQAYLLNNVEASDSANLTLTESKLRTALESLELKSKSQLP